jgi:hypothetical protein
MLQRHERQKRARKSHLNNSKLLISSTIEPERLSAAFFDRLVHPYQRRQPGNA